MTLAGLWRLGAAELARGFATGNFDPVDAMRACLDRARAASPLNPWVLLDESSALAAARESALRWSRGAPLSPLDGVPFSVKDNLHAAGWATGWGSALAAGQPRPADEVPVARLRAAGAVPFGKTTLPEFAMQGFTANLATGVTRNPWDRLLTPGGSSGGAAAAVAWGAGPLALVTDGGGSTRRPASHTGLVGYKPSAGLVPRGGGLPDLFHGFETAGVLSRTVPDARLAMEALGGLTLAADEPRGARILYVPRFGSQAVDPRIAASVEAAVEVLARAGHRVQRQDTFTAADEVHAAWPSLSAAGLAWLAGHPAEWAQAGLAPLDESRLTPGARFTLAHGRTQPAAAMEQLLGAVQRLKLAMDDVFRDCDFVLTPCTAALPWPADQPYPDRIAGEPAGPRGHAVFTSLANAAGLPAIALPTSPAGALPTGLQLIAPQNADAALLSLAAQFETLAPWAGRWPPETA